MKITNSLNTPRFGPSRADPCVFRSDADEEAEVVTVIRVDDTLLTHKSAGNIDHFVADVCAMFKIEDLGKAEYHMCCQISGNRRKIGLKIDQHPDTQAIIDRFGFITKHLIPAVARCRREVLRVH